MAEQPRWQRDEMTLPGVDFADAGEVNAHVRMVRDDQAGFQAAASLIGLGPDSTLIDVGAGAGGFAVYAAARCRHVIAVDVSEAMLCIARERARSAGLTNISFVHAGFLTYEHARSPVDAVVSHVALHHLPDAWKVIGLTRLAAMLKSGGRFHLRDVVHTFDPREYVAAFDRFVSGAVKQFGPDMGARAEATIRDEFPTWDWIMEGMLRRAGFRIDLADYRGALGEYLCTRVPRME